MRTHAILDVYSRENKAKKIVALTRCYGKVSFRNVLEVGTGSGFIASYFSKISEASVHAVDIVDERRIIEGVMFQLVEGTKLPFVNEMFDFIISNHVVEHVGSTEDQVDHLNEIFRCLEPGGMLYIAVPNRWRLIEPHYKLPFLSWFPEKLSSSLVRLLKLGSQYDCRPLSRRETVNLLSGIGFDSINVTLDAIPVTCEIEGGVTRFLTLLPKDFWRLFTIIMPTHIFLCRKTST